MLVLLFVYFRLEFASGQMKADPTRIFLSVMDEGFAFDLINELAKAFLRAEDRTAQVDLKTFGLISFGIFCFRSSVEIFVILTFRGLYY